MFTRVRICVAFFALFSGFLCFEFCSLLPQKLREKRLARDDDNDDDVFSNDDDDEFGVVQKTPIITAYY